MRRLYSAYASERSEEKRRQQERIHFAQLDTNPRTEPAMKPKYDCVVIGSGFGGSILACRLAQAGRGVCVLERGARWEKSHFARSMSQISKKAVWEKNTSYGLLELTTFDKVDVLRGAGVGGGSLWYYNVHKRAPHRIFYQKPWPPNFTRHTLEPYYDLSDQMLEVVPLSPRQTPNRAKVFCHGVERTGRKPEPLSLALNDKCHHCGHCMFGCNVQAKNTLDLNYLRIAEEHGTEIYPLHLVEKIEPLADGSYRVHFQRLNPCQPGRSERSTVVGRKVLIAAGTLGTTELLLKCKEVHRTLPKLSPALGHRFSTNGEMIFSGTLFPSNCDVELSRGVNIAAGADFSTETHTIFIEDLGFPDPLLQALVRAIPNLRYVKDIMTALFTYLLSSLGVRNGSGRIRFRVEKFFDPGFAGRFLPYLGMGSDAADGRLKLDNNGTLDLVWSHKNSMPMFREMENALRELSQSLGGKYIRSVLWEYGKKLFTAHPLGGCPMGTHPQNSVVNEYGEVWGYPDLYITDGSIIPTALGANPASTISAIAERIAFWIIHKRDIACPTSREIA
jgi:cholesterol oxidase